MATRLQIQVPLIAAVVVLAAALAYTYHVYNLAETNRRRCSEQLDRTVDALERAHRSRVRELKEHQRGTTASRATHRTLAAAFRNEAMRMLTGGRRLAATVYAAAALLHDPENPFSPYRGGGPVPPDAAGRPSVAAAQSVLYDAAVRGAIAHRRSVSKLGFRVWAAVIAPGGKVLAVAGDSRKVRLFDVKTGRPAGALLAPASPVFDLAFSPDGRTLAAATNAGKVRVWDVAQKKKLKTLDAHASMALSVRFSPDGAQLVSGGMDQRIQLWDARTWKLRGTLRDAQGAVWALAFSPNSRLLASAAWHASSSRVRLWSLKDQRPFANYAGHLGPVWSVAFSPDGEHVVSGGLDRLVRVFTAQKLRLKATLRHHRADVTSLAFSPDGRWLVSGSIDKTFALWRTDRWSKVTHVAAHSRQVWSVAFAPTGRLLVTAGWDQRARLWRVGPSRLRPTVLRPFAPNARVQPLVAVWFAQGGKRLVARDASNVFYVWDVAKAKQLARRRLLPAELRPVALSADGAHLVTPGPNDSVWVWPLLTAERARVLRGPTAAVSGVAFAPDGRMVAAASGAGTVRLWRWAEKNELDRIEKVRSPLAFSPDGKLLATSDAKRRIRLLAVKDLDPKRTLPGGGARVDHLVFGPRGRQLLSLNNDQSLTLWDPRTGKLLRQLVGHTDDVLSATFSADGRYVLTASRDRTVRLWLTRTGAELQRFTLPRVALHAALAPDGKRFAVPTPEGVALYPVQLQLWRQDPRKLLKQAEGAAGVRLDGIRLRPAD